MVFICSKKIPITEFGDLVFQFESLVDGGVLPNMVIKPQYYITSRVRTRLNFFWWNWVLIPYHLVDLK